MKKSTLTRLAAMTMAATMVFGSTFTAFADEGEGGESGSSQTVQTSGESEGEGKAEGHVERKLTFVTLPTVPTGSTPFAYTMDPERLISETSHAKYGNEVVFPASNDTGVYFNHGKKGGDQDDKDYVVYKNESPSLKVTNNSSHAIELTVKTEVVDAATTDIPLVEKDDISGATEASLYLGLKIGSRDAKSVFKDTAATDKVTIAGTPGNFKVDAKADKSGYEYRVLTLAEYKALDGNNAKEAIEWAEESFMLEGAVTSGKAITDTTSAPNVKVTWSWVDPEAAVSLDKTSATRDAENTAIVVTVNNLKTATIASVLKDDGFNIGTLTQYVAIDGDKVTFKSAYLARLASENANSLNLKIVTSENDELPFTLIINQ